MPSISLLKDAARLTKATTTWGFNGTIRSRTALVGRFGCMAMMTGERDDHHPGIVARRCVPVDATRSISRLEPRADAGADVERHTNTRSRGQSVLRLPQRRSAHSVVREDCAGVVVDYEPPRRWSRRAQLPRPARTEGRARPTEIRMHRTGAEPVSPLRSRRGYRRRVGIALVHDADSNVSVCRVCPGQHANR
jgi:hypothetical protein